MSREKPHKKVLTCPCIGYNIDSMKTAEVVRMYRAKSRRSIRDVALMVGIDNSNLSKMEKGDLTITARTARRLCKELLIPKGIMIRALREDHNARKAAEWEKILKEFTGD